MATSSNNMPDLDRLRSFLKQGTPGVKVAMSGEITTTISSEPILLPGSFNPIHIGHWQLAATARQLLKRTVAFELSVSNPDKPEIDWPEITRRLRPFQNRADVWITRAPRFVDKSELFRNALFVVGADTVARLLDTKYYDGGETGLDHALATLMQRGCRFLIAGRLNQSGEFMGIDELPIPGAFRKLFTGIGADQFRVDMSSTSIREQRSSTQP